jgi:hypothetical protein
MRAPGLSGVPVALVVLGVVGGAVALRAQQGITLEELTPRLRQYFDESMLSDVRLQLPQGAAYQIWGWDAGDFSGDGYPDLALVLRLPQERERRVWVYAFIDQDGFLLNVAQLRLPYLELPLEVGVAIRDTLCFVTQKLRARLWGMRAYRYWQGNFVLWEEQEMEVSGAQSRERWQSYATLERRECLVESGQVVRERRSITLPAYRRGYRPIGGYAQDALCVRVDFVPRGAYYWSGPEDASLRLRAAYDERFLYIAAWVRDDAPVAGRCDTCPADVFWTWFATRVVSDTPAPPKSRRARPAAPAWDIVGIGVRIGDFAERLPELLLRSPRWQELQRDPLWRECRTVVQRRPQGYVVKLRIPLALVHVSVEALGSEPIPVRFAAMLEDVDNEFRPEEASWVCTSSDFRPEMPETYGELLLLPQGQRYGELRNVFASEIVELLFRMGF